MGKKGVVAFFGIFLVFILITSLSYANENNDEKVDKKILAEFRELKSNEKLRVAVILNGEQAKKEGKSINTISKEVKGEIMGKIKYDFGNVLSMEITENELEILKNNVNVKKIEKIDYKQIFLQDSAPLINATASWDLKINGINLTGLGQAVCVIDTGVNYSHPNLGGCTNSSVVAGTCSKVIGGWDYCSDNVACSTNDADPEDRNFHGTHVSGIIAANGSLKGIATDAKIVAIKVCNSSGACGPDLIRLGIDWCINNSARYNISAISMSLGGGMYDSYCDYVDDLFNITLAINNATFHNISVVVATGNSGNYTHISSPACIKNATAVGMSYDANIGGVSWGNPVICTDSTTSADKVVCASNRNNLTDLFAPGSSIYSADLSGYATASGTSMATPHVAGAIAIMRQFLKLANITKTTLQIESTLNVTGKRISDALSNLNFGRIDVYSAIQSFDTNAPNVSLISPSNNSATLQQNITFSCNATDIQLKNITLYLWNSTALINTTTNTATGNFNLTNFTINNLALTNYSWNCYACDLFGNCSFSSANFSFLITNSSITRLISPADNIRTNNANRNFTCNSSSNYGLTNISFYLWNSSSMHYNETKSFTGIENQTIFNFSFSKEDDYKWNCLSFNNQSLSSSAASNFTITYDTTAPFLNIISPLNNSWHNAFKFNITANESLSSCWFSLNNGISNFSMTQKNATYFNFTNTSSDSNYNITFYCNDSAGNINLTSRSLNIDTTKPNISLISPIDSYSETASSTTLGFFYNATDNLNITQCSLIINNAVDSTNITLNYTSFNGSFSKTLSAGSYTWNVNCTDIAGNIGNSSLRSLTITAPSSSSSSSSSGGGGGAASAATTTAKSYTIQETQLETGYSQNIEKNDKIKFNLNNEPHILAIESLNNKQATIKISSETITFVLNILEEKKIDFDKNGYYDLSVKLNSIIEEKIDLTLKKINETIIIMPANQTDTNATNNTGNLVTGEITGKISFKEYFYIVIILIIIMAVYMIVTNIKQDKGIKGEK